MENKPVSSSQIIWKWTLINVVVAIIITYTFQFLNIDQTSSAKYLGDIPFIAFLLLAQKERKDQLGGYLTFGQGFLTGFLYSVFTGLIMGIFFYIYLAYLSPQVFGQILDASRAKMEAQGTLTSDQVDSAMQITKNYGVPIFAVSMLFGSAFIGAIIALIGAAIFKKDPPPLGLETDTDYTDPAA